LITEIRQRGQHQSPEMKADPAGLQPAAAHAAENRRQHQKPDDIAEQAELKRMKAVAQRLDHDVGEREQNGADRYQHDAAQIAGQAKPFASEAAE
jgi:hypothetical protein